MIYERSWRFRLNTEQTAIILSSVLHNMVSNFTVSVLFLWGGSLSCKISNLKCDSVNARDARAVKHENILSSHMNDF